MRSLLFITSCLEPGKDGVGDYSRVLGSHLQTRGWKIGYLAWCDPFVSERLDLGSVAEPMLRLPGSMTESERITRTLEFQGKHQFKWVSLQWVGYGYHSKGLPFHLIGSLGKLAGVVTRRHLMVHEIWIGTESGSSLRWRGIGMLQKHVFRRMVGSWAPELIHTQAPHYQKHLQGIGCKAELLPLFGNIAIAEHEMQRPSLDSRSIVVFGSVPEGVDYAPLIKKLHCAATSSGIKLQIRCIGRNGVGLDSLRRACESTANMSICLEVLGEMQPDSISRVLLSADFGLGLARPELLCKSGSATAFDEHGLPILCARPGTVPEVLRTPPFFRVPLITLDEIGDDLFHTRSRLEPQSKLSAIADLFLKDLQET